MKFFTRQLYEQMQVWSFLTNFLNEDDNYIGNWWLWNETHLSDTGNFDFEALFHDYDSNGKHSLNTFRVIANKVSLSFSNEVHTNEKS